VKQPQPTHLSVGVAEHVSINSPLERLIENESDDAAIPEALRRFVHDSLAAVATGLGFLYLLFAFAHALLLPPALKVIMAPVAALTALFLWATALYLRRIPSSNRHAHAHAALIAALVLINSWLHLWLTGDPLQSTNLMLLIVGVGFFFLSLPWFVFFVLGVLLLWAVTFFLMGISANESIHFAFGLLSSALLAMLAHLSRKHTLTRLTRLHLRDARHAQALQAALDAEKEGEAALRHSENEYRQLSIRLEEQAEALRLANEELAYAATLKDEFLANMSHELRTPLTAILGLTESLREEIYGPMTDRQLGAISNVYESGRHLLALINDILDVAKLEAGKLQAEFVPTDAHMIAEASLRFIQTEAEKKQLSLQFDDDGLVTTFLADERRVKQMLVNLLSNAVKFTNDGGRIGLRLTGDVKQRVVRFAVWDTGIGIAQEQMEQLFQPFVQLDSRLSRRYAGTGLGLVLTYRMAEIHGGSVTVESRPGRGSTFTIALPWRKLYGLREMASSNAPQKTVSTSAVSQAETTEAPLSLIPALRPSLLVVDKQVAVRSWIEELIALRSPHVAYDILPASTAADALRLAHEVHPQLIFVELRLGGNEGVTLIRTLAADPQLCNTPIVAWTALGLPGEEAQARAAGAHIYLCKPLRADTLQELLAQIGASFVAVHTVKMLTKKPKTVS